MTSFSTRSEPLVIAHRGVSGHRVENSMAAFLLAVENGPFHSDGIELDFHTTADGHFVVCHDPVLPSGRAIVETLLQDVLAERLPDDSHIPLLADVLPLADRIDLFCEAKGLPEATDAALLRLIRDARGSRRIHVHAFDHRIIRRLAFQAPDGSYGVLSASYPVDPVAPVLEAGARTLWQESALIDEALVRQAASAGVAVVAWTVNDPAEAERLRRIGVAGICGNWPERLRGPAPGS